MTQRGNHADEVKFCCSICLDLLKDPVTTPCGHNYCMSCIKTHWDEEEQKKTHSCPQCRQTFMPRPVLGKNTMLAELVDELKRTGLQADPAGHRCARPGDVGCDFCTGRKLKAFKSCLVCLASNCEKHLQPHYESATFKKHKLVDASFKLQDNVCSRHDEVMKMFCRTDQRCICYLCSMVEHKDHDTVCAAAERAEKQEALGRRRKTIQRRIQDQAKEVELLQHETKTINRSADEAVETSERISTELIRRIEKRSHDVKQQIRSQQKTRVGRLKELQEKMEEEIAELKRKDGELEQLSRTEDHTRFLSKYHSLSDLTGSTDPPRPKTNHLQYFEDVIAAVTEVRDKTQVVLAETRPSVEPTTRTEFLQYSRQITLDPNTTGIFLVLSKRNRKITYNAPYLMDPDRCIYISHILSKDGLTGCCYWEVEMSGNAGVAVAYRSRSGDCEAYVFGSNEKSWVLCCDNVYSFKHDGQSLSISGPKSSRVGVYLDHSAGVLSFHSVSETTTLLHRVQTTFTRPLYAGLYLGSDGDTAEVCELT